MENMKINHKDMILKYSSDAENMKMYCFETENTASDEMGKASAPNFLITTSEDETLPMEGCAAACAHSNKAKCISFKQNKGGITAKYLCAGDKLEVTVKMQFIKGANVIRQINSVKNISKENVTVTHFSSAAIMGLALGGSKKWYLDGSKIKVHYCLSHWQGEAQWRESTLDNLGIYKKTAHTWDATSWRARSVGSWSTGKYYPLVMLEDTETGTIWYMEIEGGLSWTIEVGNQNGHSWDTGSFYLEANSADEETGFVKVMRPGQTYTASPAVFGCTDGSFEEAVKQLTIYKRATTIAKWNKDNVAPAFFNDYMDCLWGQSNREKLIPLIDKAAECGAEYFCLDAGWFKSDKGMGEWIPNDEIYGEKGLKGIFDYIKEKGMLPGAWLEIESVNPGSPMYNNGALLKRNGTFVSKGRFADFTDKAQCDYIESVFDNLYSMGVRFVKNDYNLSTMYGAQMRGASPAEGLKKHVDAFYAFIDRIKSKYPDLYIENCGSGAMRCDTGTLRHFNLQSTSDQEFYYLNPSIISGSCAYLAPEKAGIWSYPYPISYYENMQKKDIYTKEYMQCMADGEQTAFNMINALCGTLYLSGRIDKADDFNSQLIKEGVEVFKKYRVHTSKAFPVWPCGKLSISDRTHSALGMLSDDGKKMTLAVWKLEDEAEVIEIDLSKYFADKKVKAEYVYPLAIATEYTYNVNTCKLSVRMPKDRTARFFELNVI